ncbi:MAG: hypothetical protein ACO1RX_19085 [Candidatus Sericytochromatia bacterium]
MNEFVLYVRRAGEFNARDWLVYVLWVLTIFALCAITGGFLAVGHAAGVRFPGYVWNIPLGALVFTAAIAVDTIGHRTVYKEELQKYEALVHHITIFSGVTSVLALCLAYEHRELMAIPAAVLLGLSVFYSALDECMHWIRYAQQKSDRVEMWSHYSILLGHLTMMAAWWLWFQQGYPGVAETLAVLGA